MNVNKTIALLLVFLFLFGCTSNQKQKTFIMQGGGTNFLGLNDTPNSYSGDGNKLVSVNPGATGLVFIPRADINGGSGSVDANGSDFNKTYLRLNNANQSLWNPTTTKVPNLNADLLDGNDSSFFWQRGDLRQATTDWATLGLSVTGDVNISDTKKLRFYSTDDFLDTSFAYIQFVKSASFGESQFIFSNDSSGNPLVLVGSITRDATTGGIRFDAGTGLDFGTGDVAGTGAASIVFDGDARSLNFVGADTGFPTPRVRTFNFNPFKKDSNFNYSGLNDSNLFFCNANLGFCGIRIGKPIVNLDINGTSKFRMDANFDANISIEKAVLIPKTNNCAGLSSLVAGTVTVTTPCADGNYMVLYAVQTQGGTVGTVELTTKNTGNFILASANVLDTSSVYWRIEKIR